MGLATRSAPYRYLACVLVACALPAQPALAQSLEDQYEFYLTAACFELDFERVPDDPGRDLLPGQAGPELDQYCSRLPPTAGPGGTTTATTGSGVSSPDAAAAATRRRQAAQRKDEPAGNADEFGILTSGATSLFASLNYAREDQKTRRFEGGRRNDQLALTLGLDRRLGARGLLGIAAGIEDQSADLDAGGTSDARGYTALLYGSWLPGASTFVDFNGGFAFRDTETSRAVSFLRTQPLEEIEPARADSTADQQEWRGSLLAGYDASFGGNSIGPRLAMEYRRTTIDGYSETGVSAMALVVDRQVEESLRSGLGLQASHVMNGESAVYVIQLNADWWHEFEDDQRYIGARFAQDLRPEPVRFRYQNQPPDRDVFTARASLAVTMPRGFSVFASVDGLIGHSYLGRYGAALGLRKEL